MRFILRPSLLLVLLTIWSSAGIAQEAEPLTLARAVALALEKNPVRKAALAETKIAKADTSQTRSFLLPHIGFAESAIRSNDPVFVFGTKLRQQRFTASDFALDSLNRPTPISDLSSKFSGQWTLFDSRQSWLGVSHAKLMEQASAHQLERTDQELIFRVVQSYYAALLATRQLAVAERSLKTAESIEAQSRNRVESGLAVDSDLMSAQVQTAARRQEYIRATNDAAFAKVQLAIAVGLSPDTPLTLAENPPSSSPVVAKPQELEAEALRHRPDLKRAQSEQSAQGKSVSMAKAAFGPRLNAFSSWQTDSRNLGWTGGNNWTAGLELQIDLFAGGGKLAELSRQRATQERGDAMVQSFTDSIRLEVRRAYFDADSARQQLEVARAATAQSDESLRIQQNRYEAGLSTLTDLLRVEEAQHRATTDYWNAVYRVATSYAALELATGTLTPESPAVKP
jgi:outer membrane protein TolC